MIFKGGGDSLNNKKNPYGMSTYSHSNKQAKFDHNLSDVNQGTLFFVLPKRPF